MATFPRGCGQRRGSDGRPGFTVEEQRDRLRGLHDLVQEDGPFTAYSTRRLSEARKTGHRVPETVGARDQGEVREILVDVICGSRRPSERELRLAREVYAYGSLSDRVADLIRGGEAASNPALATHFPEPGVCAIDALVEGWWIYQSWSSRQLDPGIVRDAIDALADKFAAAPVSSPGSPTEPTTEGSRA